MNTTTVAVRPNRSRLFSTLAAASIACAGCGNLTAGGVAEADVYVSGDHEPTEPSPAAVSESSTPAAAPILLAEGDDEPEGEMEVEFELFLVPELGQPVRLGDDELRVRVDLQGVELHQAVEDQRISVVRYTEIRMVFTEIRADIDGGLVIDGIPVLGEVRVQLDDISLEVLRPVDLDVQPSETVELTLDMNAPAWLAAVNPVTRTVDEAVFAALIGVHARVVAP